MDNRISDAELLKFALDSGMLDYTTTLQSYEMSKRKELLEKHPCRIWQGEKNGMWYTYIPLENGKRRLIKKKTKEQVEDVIIENIKDEPSVNEVLKNGLKKKCTMAK